MNKNIKKIIEKNKKEAYHLISSEEVYVPSFVFETKEEAEIALSIIKYMNKNNRGNDYHQIIKYAFRAIGINSAWSK